MANGKPHHLKMYLQCKNADSPASHVRFQGCTPQKTHILHRKNSWKKGLSQLTWRISLPIYHPTGPRSFMESVETPAFPNRGNCGFRAIWHLKRLLPGYKITTYAQAITPFINLFSAIYRGSYHNSIQSDCRANLVGFGIILKFRWISTHIYPKPILSWPLQPYFLGARNGIWGGGGPQSG